MKKKIYQTMFLSGQYGSGKDTHSEFIADIFDLTPLSFSSFLSQDHRARSYIELSQLVPDSDVFRILGAYPMKGILFNGFPRTIKQLDFILDTCQVATIAMVYLDVADDVAVFRMQNRVVCSVCGTATSLLKGHTIGGPCKIHGCSGVLTKRSDDTPEGIVKRMNSFRIQTLPLLDIAEKSGIKIYRIKIMEEQAIEKTQEMITQALCESVSYD